MTAFLLLKKYSMFKNLLTYSKSHSIRFNLFTDPSFASVVSMSISIVVFVNIVYLRFNMLAALN